MATAVLQKYTDELHTEIKIPKTHDEMTAAQRYAKLEHSYAQSLAAEGRPYEEVFDEIERSLAR